MTGPEDTHQDDLAALIAGAPVTVPGSSPSTVHDLCPLSPHGEHVWKVVSCEGNSNGVVVCEACGARDYD